ncbi:hypothetical protein BDV95DRAFT_595597 [Massariosphaeria phaeospora]|uniref:Uncharacterized protein n=1 Tax=Massariosphaeria phaeospora TaxID=100035 RepID=A0A7C8MLR4_9PLEO|nr:hypothetical protein BDV95DRAFT_595597 [Massariosphaeria phaeospora]
MDKSLRECSRGPTAYGNIQKVQKGDVFVLPAGVSHASIESKDDFEYVGFYEVDAPMWDMNYCKDDAEMTATKAERCAQVPIPQADPVFGVDGPLPKIWQSI